jgi:hypothetical protein
MEMIRLVWTFAIVLITAVVAAQAGPPKQAAYKEIPDLPNDAERHIVVKAEDRGPVWLLTGFLNSGHPDIEFETIVALKPQHWRYDLWPFWNPRSISIAGDKQKSNDNIDIKRIDRDSPAFMGQFLETMLRLRETGMTWQMVLQHEGPYYEVFRIKQEQLKDYYDHIYLLVKYAKHMGLPIDYWEIWNEPATGPFQYEKGVKKYDDFFWRGNWQEYLAMWDISYDAIRAANPDAKIVGPSYGVCDANTLIPFLEHCKGKGQRLDVLSWHEILTEHSAPGVSPKLVEPDKMHKNIEEIRNLVERKYPMLGVAEYHIDEWGYKKEYVGPGTQMAFFYYLDLAGVTKAAKSLWVGGELLNNILLDPKTPRTSYWAWKAYADGVGKRLVTETNDRCVVAIASRNENSKTVRTVVGRSRRYPALPSGRTLPPVKTKIDFEGLPITGSAQVTILTLGPEDGSLLEKELAELSAIKKMAVNEGKLTLVLDSVEEEQVYSITICAWTD